MLGRLVIIGMCAVIFSGLVMSCKPEVKKEQPVTKIPVVKDEMDKNFQDLAEKFVAELLELNPEWATNLGEHKYDGKLNDYSIEGINKGRVFNQKYLAELEKNLS